MYCKKCGKFIEGNADVCDECIKLDYYLYANQQGTAYQKPPQSVQNASATPAYNSGSKAKGLGYGIFGLIIAIVGAIVIAVGYFNAYMGLGTAYTTQEAVSAVQTGEATCWVGVIIGVIALICGIVAIRTFVTHNRKTGVKAVPTLVFGIISVVEGVGTILLGFIFLITLSAVLAVL